MPRQLKEGPSVPITESEQKNNFIIPEGENPIDYGAMFLRQEVKDIVINGPLEMFPIVHYMNKPVDRRYIAQPVSKVEGSEPLGKFSEIYNTAILLSDGTIKMGIARFAPDETYPDLEKISALPENFKPATNQQIVDLAPFLFRRLYYEAAKQAEVMQFGLLSYSEKQLTGQIAFLEQGGKMFDRILDISNASRVKNNQKPLEFKPNKKFDDTLEKLIESKKRAYALYQEKPEIMARVVELVENGNSSAIGQEITTIIKRVKALNLLPKKNYDHFRTLEEYNKKGILVIKEGELERESTENKRYSYDRAIDLSEDPRWISSDQNIAGIKGGKLVAVSRREKITADLSDKQLLLYGKNIADAILQMSLRTELPWIYKR